MKSSGLSPKDKNLVKALSLLFLTSAGTLRLGLWATNGSFVNLVGSLTLANLLAKTVLKFQKYLKAPLELRAVGKWSIVTGCTGGLGQDFAINLAKKGQNLILISRNKKKLDLLGQKLAESEGIQFISLAFDFSKSSLEEEKNFYENILPKTIQTEPVNEDIALLVNNVGVGDEAPYMVEEMKVSDVGEMIKVNCGAMVNVSAAVLPFMRKQGKGSVINVSSGSSRTATPFLSTYSATKAFNYQFSRSCAREYEEYGIKVLCIRPYYISGTGLYPNDKPALNAPASKVIVEGSFDALGRYETSHAYYIHELMGFIFDNLLENPVLSPFLGYVANKAGMNGSMLQIQKSARRRAKL